MENLTVEDLISVNFYWKCYTLDEDQPPVRFNYVGCTMPNDEYQAETVLICDRIKHLFTKTNLTQPESQTIACEMIPQLFVNIRHPVHDFRKMVSLKALHDILLFGEDKIMARLVDEGILVLAWDVFQAHHNPWTENLSLTILAFIFEQFQHVRDYLIQKGFVQNLIDAGRFQLEKLGDGDAYDNIFRCGVLLTNIIWGIERMLRVLPNQKMATPPVIHESIAVQSANKLLEFISSIIKQSFVLQRTWTDYLARAVGMSLDTLNRNSEVDEVDRLVTEGIQEMLENFHPNSYNLLGESLRYHLLTYPTNGVIKGKIMDNKLTAWKKLIKNFGSYLREMNQKRFMDLHSPLSRLFYLFSGNRHMHPLILESGCLHLYAKLFECGVKDEVKFLSPDLSILVNMMDHVLENSSLDDIRCLCASGFPSALQQYRHALKQSRLLQTAGNLEFMLENLLVKLQEFEDSDLVQNILWPESKEKEFQ